MQDKDTPMKLKFFTNVLLFFLLLLSCGKGRWDLLKEQLDTMNAGLRESLQVDSTLFNKGSIRLQEWNNLSNSPSIEEFTDLAAFPSSPIKTQMLSAFRKAESNESDWYGNRVLGYLFPETSGEYIFYLSCDTLGEFWLSNGPTEENQSLIVNLSGGTPSDLFNQPRQSSGPVFLQGGGVYSIELLTVHASGTEHFAVAWKKPGDSSPVVIPGDSLAPPLDN